MNNKYEYLRKIMKLEDQAYRLDRESWLKYEFLSWQWWILLLFLTIPWILWVKLVDRSRIIEILLLGLITLFVTSLLDIIGVQLRFWVYPTQLAPITARALPFDCSLVPVGFMLLNQYFVKWKTFLMGLFILAIMYSFVGEPFSMWIGVVQYIKWKYIYSFLYYIVLGILSRLLIRKLMDIQKQSI